MNKPNNNKPKHPQLFLFDITPTNICIHEAISAPKKTPKMLEIEVAHGEDIQVILHTKYVIEKKSTYEIGQELKCAQTSIVNWVNLFNIPMRGYSERAKLFSQSDVFRSNMSRLVKQRWESDDYRKRHSEQLKQRWNSPAFRENMEKIFQSDECRKKRSKTTKQLWQSAEFREKQGKALRAVIQTEEHRDKLKEAFRKRGQSKEYKKKLSESAKKRWALEENRKEASRLTKRCWENPPVCPKKSQWTMAFTQQTRSSHF